MKDIQIAFRQFGRSPGFVVTVVLNFENGADDCPEVGVSERALAR